MIASPTRRRARAASGLFDELVIDNFAGGGGASIGIERAIGRAIDLAINHDRAAIEMHSTNHPHTRHLCEDVWQVDPRKATGGRRVGLAWFSPDCKHFSKAKGGKPVSKKIRGLAWVVIRWAKSVKPRVIILENVEEFQDWGPLVHAKDASSKPMYTAHGEPVMMPDKSRKGLTFRRWVGCLRNIGYVVEWRELRACNYGAPTTRKRLFLIARCDGRPIVWPEPTHGPGRKPYRTAAECIDWSLPCPSIFTRKRPLAEKTMRRIAMGLKRYVLDNPRPFIVTCNHSGPEFRGQSIDEPFRTITGARDAHGVIVPTLVECANSNWSDGIRSSDRPAPTVTATPKGGSWALVSAFLAKHYGGVVGQSLEKPIGTVTAIDHHSAVAAHLTKYHGQKGNESCAKSPAEPLPTQDTSNRYGLVYAFLTKYFGTNIGLQVDEPLQTVTSKHRFGLVTVTIGGEPYVITDIGLRMLTPRELATAQGFPTDYVLTGTKSNQVARIGNSVSPIMAEVLVRANQ